MNDFKILKGLIEQKHEHFLFVSFDVYKRWKWLIRGLVFINSKYINCEIFRKEYKFQKRIVVVGLKWNGKKVKRRTTGYAKEFIEQSRWPRCLYCKRELTSENATSDHIIPISEGGNNAQINIVVCCKECNNERGNANFRMFLGAKNPKFKNVKYPFV